MVTKIKRATLEFINLFIMKICIALLQDYYSAVANPEGEQIRPWPPFSLATDFGPSPTKNKHEILRNILNWPLSRVGTQRT